MLPILLDLRKRATVPNGLPRLLCAGAVAIACAACSSSTVLSEAHPVASSPTSGIARVSSPTAASSADDQDPRLVPVLDTLADMPPGWLVGDPYVGIGGVSALSIPSCLGEGDAQAAPDYPVAAVQFVGGQVGPVINEVIEEARADDAAAIMALARSAFACDHADDTSFDPPLTWTYAAAAPLSLGSETYARRVSANAAGDAIVGEALVIRDGTLVVVLEQYGVEPQSFELIEERAKAILRRLEQQFPAN